VVRGLESKAILRNLIGLLNSLFLSIRGGAAELLPLLLSSKLPPKQPKIILNNVKTKTKH
jgi:hypothetical protein